MVESIEKLRELVKSFHSLKSRWDTLAAIDEVEHEIERDYMKLPVDADGVPIRIGDTVREVDDRVPMKVMSLTFYEDRVDVNACCMNPNLLRHVKPRTVEDVLRDCCDEWNEHCGDDWEQGVYAKYAAELRELMEVGK